VKPNKYVKKPKLKDIPKEEAMKRLWKDNNKVGSGKK